MGEGQESHLHVCHAARVDRLQHPAGLWQVRVDTAESGAGLGVCAQVGRLQRRMGVDEANQLASGIPGGAQYCNVQGHTCMIIRLSE